jgi:SCY1-like protein 2
MKDPQLLPSILPNVFAIARVLLPTQFALLVLPSLKPLFTVKDPPQNMMTLLDNLKLLQEKTDKPVFLEREYSNVMGDDGLHRFAYADVMPLVYNALDSEHSVVSSLNLLCITSTDSHERCKNVH